MLSTLIKALTSQKLPPQSLSCQLSILSFFRVLELLNLLNQRESCFTVHLEQGKHFSQGQWLIIPTVPSLGFLVHIGEGYRMVRELFVMAREHAPSIIFMDEIHSIGSARMESGTGNGDSEVQRTMLELLNQLEGFEASNKIKLLMATNTIDILDSALLRPTNMLLGLSRNFRLQSDFISNPTSLRRRLMLIEIAMLLLSPFSIIFMVVFHFLRHAERFYNHPSIASSRRWSNLSRWIFREFNEVDHLFKHRMNSSVIHADEYLKQFPSPIISIIAKFVSFVFGGFAAILIIIAILDESLLEGHIYGRNLLWYAAVFGTVTAISRAAITEDLQVRNPEGAMSLVVQHTHHMPKRWRGKENSDVVRTEFETLFQYTGMMLLEEMASIFLTPFLLIFVVPQRVEDILQFISNFTVDVEGVGHVCSLSVFDFERHGNSNYAAPYNTPQTQRSSGGELEKSFSSFHSSYPTWEPDAAGKQF